MSASGNNILGLILTTLQCSVICTDVCPTIPCNTEVRAASEYSWFSMNGRPLPHHARAAIIYDSNVTECFMNTTDVWNHFNFTKSPQIATVYITSMNPVRVHMLPYEGSLYENVISYLRIHSCKTTVYDWNQLSVGTDMRVITLMMDDYGNDCETTTSVECKSLQHLAAFAYMNKGNQSPNLNAILSCAAVYPEMAEAVFSNMSWTQLPKELPALFPNLESLSLVNNNFIVPPNVFPWTKEVQNLPRNLTRSGYMANYYSVSIDLDIPANKYKRLFDLSQNRIRNLTGFSFHGHLHMINLNENGMTNIGKNVFQNVTGLQVINLSHNKLTSVPIGIFRRLISLRCLDLTANTLDTLPEGIFDDLKSLRYLSLANNSLTVLKYGLFTQLRNLMILHLEYNKLTTLDSHTYPWSSIFLKEIYVHNNPIKELPEFIFLIRSLSLADFHKTEIVLDNLTAFFMSIDKQKIASSIFDSANVTNMDALKERSYKVRVIDLSDCKIKSLYLEEITVEIRSIITLLLQHFKLVLINNPVNCDCKIIPFSNLVAYLQEKQILSSNEYFFNEWLCKYPSELRNRPIFDVRTEETYCFLSNLSGCPKECRCFNRSVNANIIVDCRNLNLTTIHGTFPKGILELWYAGNNISFVGSNRFMKNVYVLDISMNKVASMDDGVFKQARKLKELYLQSNFLTYLPKSIESLRLEIINLSENHFYCDCHSLWMKHWILKNRPVILGWNELSCTNKVSGKKLIDVKDSDFICMEEFNDTDRDVVIPSVTCSVILCFIVISGLVIYAYRLECKVLMYVYFGVHPFDTDTGTQEESLDCVIVHSEAITDWVMNNIVNVLESKDNGFVVCDMARDFVIGFSMQENLTRMVRHSKRIIFCLSEDWEQANKNIKLAWIIAQEKIKETRSNYAIIVNHGLESINVTDRELLRLMKRGRQIDSSKRLFIEKVIYSMPRKEHRAQYHGQDDDIALLTYGRRIPQSFIEIEEGNISEVEGLSPSRPKWHLYMSYCDADTDYVIHHLRPVLESRGYILCIPDRDFLAGPAKEENILAAINASSRTLFILSNSHIVDEWSLFAFRNAYEKSLREKTNHLIVITRDGIDKDDLDEEVRHYLKTYASLAVNDRWFEKKLLNGLPLLKRCYQNHTAPLLATCVDNVHIDINE